MTYKAMVFTTTKKSPNIWATFVIKFIAMKFQKLPNLVTLVLVSMTIIVNRTEFKKTIKGVIISCLNKYKNKPDSKR